MCQRIDVNPYLNIVIHLESCVRPCDQCKSNNLSFSAVFNFSTTPEGKYLARYPLNVPLCSPASAVVCDLVLNWYFTMYSVFSELFFWKQGRFRRLSVGDSCHIVAWYIVIIEILVIAIFSKIFQLLNPQNVPKTWETSLWKADHFMVRWVYLML